MKVWAEVSREWQDGVHRGQCRPWGFLSTSSEESPPPTRSPVVWGKVPCREWFPLASQQREALPGSEPRGPVRRSTRLPRSRVSDARTQFRSFTPHAILPARKATKMKVPSTGGDQCLILLSSGWFLTSGPSSWRHTTLSPPHRAALDTLSPLTPEDAAGRGGQKLPAGLANHQEWCGPPPPPRLAQEPRHRPPGPTLWVLASQDLAAGSLELPGPLCGVGWGQGEQRAGGFLPEGLRTGGMWVVRGSWGGWAQLKAGVR